MDTSLSSSAAAAAAAPSSPAAAPPQSAAAASAAASPLFGTVTIHYNKDVSDALDTTDHRRVANDLLRADFYDYKETGVENMLVTRNGQWNTERVGIHGKGVVQVIYSYLLMDTHHQISVTKYRVTLHRTKEEQDAAVEESDCQLADVEEYDRQFVLPLSDVTFTRNAANYEEALKADRRTSNRESYEGNCATMSSMSWRMMPPYNEEGILPVFDPESEDDMGSGSSSSDSSSSDDDDEEEEKEDLFAQADEDDNSSGQESEESDSGDLERCETQLAARAERQSHLVGLPMDKRIEAAVKDVLLSEDDSVITLMIEINKRNGDYGPTLGQLAEAINKPDVPALVKCQLFRIPRVNPDATPEMIKLAKETWSDRESPLRVAYDYSLEEKPAGKWFHAALKRAINNEPLETRRFFELAGMFGWDRMRIAERSVASAAALAAAASAESEKSEEDDDDDMSFEGGMACWARMKRRLFSLPMDKRLEAVAKDAECGSHRSIIYSMISSFDKSGQHNNELEELSAAINQPGVPVELKCRLALIPNVELPITPEMIKLAEETWKDIESPLRIAYTSSHFKTISDVTFVDRLKDAIRKENSDLRLQFYLQGMNDVDGGEDFPADKRRPDEFPREIKEHVTEDNLSDDGKDKDVPTVSNKRKEPAAASAASSSAEEPKAKKGKKKE